MVQANNGARLFGEANRIGSANLPETVSRRLFAQRVAVARDEVDLVVRPAPEREFAGLAKAPGAMRGDNLSYIFTDCRGKSHIDGKVVVVEGDGLDHARGLSPFRSIGLSVSRRRHRKEYNRRGDHQGAHRDHNAIKEKLFSSTVSNRTLAPPAWPSPYHAPGDVVIVSSDIQCAGKAARPGVENFNPHSRR